MKVFNSTYSGPCQEGTLTSILVCNYMKTFDNEDTGAFMKEIKVYSKKWSTSGHYLHQVGLLMNKPLLGSINKPLVELHFGEKITSKNEVILPF